MNSEAATLYAATLQHLTHYHRHGSDVSKREISHINGDRITSHSIFNVTDQSKTYFEIENVTHNVL